MVLNHLLAPGYKLIYTIVSNVLVVHPGYFQYSCKFPALVLQLFDLLSKFLNDFILYLAFYLCELLQILNSLIRLSNLLKLDVTLFRT